MSVVDAALDWMACDVSDADRAELQSIVDSADGVALASRMAPLTFGTAGLRAPLRAGPNGMNRAVVIRTTSGVARWLASHGHMGGIVYIGHDARRGSAQFATDAAAVMAAAGFDARLITPAVPTPVLAAAVTRQNAVAGIQITASHNPAGDNGYKLYDSSGAQIVPPSDAEVEAAIAAAPGASHVPRSQAYTTVHDDVVEPYVERLARLPRTDARDVRVALSALHGVGASVAVQAFQRAGFTDVHVVQGDPDPDFGGMAFPNPEEPGVCDPLLELATRVDADLAIALDPDADRCALGIPLPGNGFRMLRGDEAGCLLAEHMLSTMDTAGGKPLLATTIVSSSMPAHIAAAHGARYVETLTGFKWLARAGEDLVFAYEEALGLCVDPDAVHDKDGISAALVAAGLAAERKRAGSSLADALDELDERHGVHRTDQIAIRVSEVDQIRAIMNRLRAQPPPTLAGRTVEQDDLLPRTDALRYRSDDVRVVVRPSGTEPKLKAYLQVTRPPTRDVGAARAAAEVAMTRLREAVGALLND